MEVVKDENLELTPDENGQIQLTQEQMEEMFQLAEKQELEMKNPYTHQLNFDNIKTLEDVIAVLNSFDINIDPNQWSQDKKYIKAKGK